MRIVQPKEVTPAILTSTDVVNAEANWTAGTYTLGVRKVYSNQVYEVVADPSTADQPDVGAAAVPPTWALIGWSNQYRMFRDGADSLSTAVGDIDVLLEYGETVSVVAALGLLARYITVVMTDPTEGEVFNETKDLADIGVADWWEFWFLPYEQIDTAVFDVPPYPDAEIQILIEGFAVTDDVACGRIVAGIARRLGVTLYDTDIQIQDYSIKERDGFGTLRLVPRRTLSLVNYNVHVKTHDVDFVIREMKKLGGIPTLYIGEPDKTSTVVFGVFADVSQGISTPSLSDLTLQVEEF